MLDLSPTLLTRFLSGVDKLGPDECWPWTKATAHYGHGEMYVGRKDGKFFKTRVQRVAWWAEHGAFPSDDEVVRHSCDNPPCCNPAHLLLGTQADNIADMVARRRNRAASHSQRLTAEQVRQARTRAAAGEARREIAKDLGISKSHLSNIIAGRVWNNNNYGKPVGRPTTRK